MVGYTLMERVLGLVDLEGAGHLARSTLHLAESSPPALAVLARLGGRVADTRLEIAVAGVPLENPLLVGAGWDKGGGTVRALHALGFAGVEVGTVLPRPQSGNPRPRQALVGRGVELNNIGFCTPPGGLAEVERNLRRYVADHIPIGVSLGKNASTPVNEAAEDYATVAARLSDTASYFAINVSSPNTPGLRRFQETERLREVIRAVRAVTNRPLLVKVSPDLSPSQLDAALDVAVGEGVAGIIAANTTTNPAIKALYGVDGKPGGISGNDPCFRRITTKMVARIYREAGKHLSVVGVGGIRDTETALEKIRAGASAVQIVTALGIEGPGLPGRLLRGFINWMEQEGVTAIRDVVGVDAALKF